MDMPVKVGKGELTHEVHVMSHDYVCSRMYGMEKVKGKHHGDACTLRVTDKSKVLSN